MEDLLDTTFAIIFKADSTERIENIKIVYKHLTKYYRTNINVIEIGKEPILSSYFAASSIGLTYSFAFDADQDLNMTKYRNIQIQACSTNYIALWDTDVLIEASQVTDALDKLRSGAFQVALPYNGKLVEINAILKSILKETGSFQLITKILQGTTPMYGNISVGAAVIFNKAFYLKAGMDNRKFTKWGHDDIERIKRVEILGARIYRTAENAYHLCHPRFSFGNDEQIQKDRILSRNEMVMISSFYPTEIENYIQSWS